jgi:hypothetical protein
LEDHSVVVIQTPQSGQIHGAILPEIRKKIDSEVDVVVCPKGNLFGTLIKRPIAIEQDIEGGVEWAERRGVVVNAEAGHAVVRADKGQEEKKWRRHLVVGRF